MLVGTRRSKIFCRAVPSPRLAAVFELFLSPWIRHPWSSRTTLARRTRLLLSPSQAFLFTRPSASSAPHTVPHSTHPTFPKGHQSTDRTRITRRSSHELPSRGALGFRYRNLMCSSLYLDRSRGASRQHRLGPPCGDGHIGRSASAGKLPRRHERCGVPPRDHQVVVTKEQGSRATGIGHRSRRQRSDARDGRGFIHLYPYPPAISTGQRRIESPGTLGCRPTGTAGLGTQRSPGGALGGAFYSRLGRVHSRPRAWWSIKPMTVSYQRRALFGFRIQWFSSGK